MIAPLAVFWFQLTHICQVGADVNGDDGRSVFVLQRRPNAGRNAESEHKEDNKRSVLKHTGRDFGRRLPSGLLSPCEVAM